ncbi:2-dehydropantoate 2-reductase [Capronia coronata CBS 617.96]|uniref:2-dehydropantoate 2-reductase n=1 Tax=Capronia coronata CBS 617.96 TaxID=1182541 RepID=W9YNN0_9EURO|nr:2-dehydropantoate 2-reductase [Capronia coronata CBS 617.96]EXJ94532.1 2-dehydropantoate 2-reductase [Capronia coronata CBS 617.96]
MLEVCLIGAGGVGTIAAYVLEKSQQARVTAVLRSNYAVVREQGFDIDSVDHGDVRGWKPWNIVPSLSAAIPKPATSTTTTSQDQGHVQGYDFVVITTKALPDLIASLIPDLNPLVTPGKTSLVLIQNGLDIEAPLAAAFPDTPILSGISMIGSRLTSPRSIFHEDPDLLKLGAYFHHQDDSTNNIHNNKNHSTSSSQPEPQSSSSSSSSSSSLLSRETQLASARRFVDLYNAGLGDAHAKTGAECVLVHDVVAARWRKLLWNASFNTLCTLLRISVGELQSSPGRAALLEPAMREIAAVATAAGFGETVSDEIVAAMLDETPASSPFRPSMLVDLEKGRPFELDVILGAPLRVASEYNVPTPVLTQVYELLRVVQWTLQQNQKKIQER